MKTEQFEVTRNKTLEFVRPALVKMLPSTVAVARVNALKESAGTLIAFLREYIHMMVQAYWQLAMRASQYSNLALGGAHGELPIGLNNHMDVLAQESDECAGR